MGDSQRDSLLREKVKKRQQLSLSKYSHNYHWKYLHNIPFGYFDLFTGDPLSNKVFQTMSLVIGAKNVFYLSNKPQVSLLYLWVRDCCECFVFKYTHALTVQWTRNFQYCTKRSWVQYWKFRVHCTVSKCVYLKTKHELTVSNPFNIQFEFTAGDRLAVASRATCLNEKTMSQEKQMKTRTFNVQEYLI